MSDCREGTNPNNKRRAGNDRAYRCTTEVIALPLSVTIICGRYSADSPQHES